MDFPTFYRRIRLRKPISKLVLSAGIAALSFFIFAFLPYITIGLQASNPIAASFDPSWRSGGSIQISSNAYRGDVRVYPSGGSQANSPSQKPVLYGTETDPNGDQLWVGGRSAWAHMRLWRGQPYNSQSGPILQAGLAEGPSRYKMACARWSGNVIVGWGLRRVRNGACETLRVHASGSYSRNGDSLYAEHLSKADGAEIEKDKLYAQSDPPEEFSDDDLFVKRLDELSLIYVHDQDQGVAVDVLVGQVEVQPGRDQQERNLEAGQQYIYFGGIRPAITQSIEVPTVAQSSPMETFLSSENWASDLAPLLEQYKAAIFGPISLTPEQQAILDMHNQCRSDVGVGNLNWSNEIAASAQAWAEQLGATGGFEHDSSSPYGENLAGGNTVSRAVDQWCAEKEKYNPETGQCRGDPFSCYHYTQVVWRNTRELGCGIADHRRWGKVIVCSYNPPGNFRGQRPY
ncbi:CAP domain-containing protein [Leptothoe sp. EHU-05/26/07-4]